MVKPMVSILSILLSIAGLSLALAILSEKTIYLFVFSAVLILSYAFVFVNITQNRTHKKISFAKNASSKKKGLNSKINPKILKKAKSRTNKGKK